MVLVLMLAQVGPAEAAVGTSGRSYWPTVEWQEQSPEAAGFAPEALARLDSHVQGALPHMRSLLIVRGGRLVFERYYQGTGRDTLFDTASVTKSVTSIMVGIALKQGLISSIDAPIGGLVSDCAASRLGTLTLRHLMGMQGGFASPNRPPYLTVKLACGRGLASEPGTVFAYDSAAAHIVLAAIASQARTSAATFTFAHLFRPLGIRAVDWGESPEGRPYYGGGGLSLRARDLAKLGYLYLNDGRWERRQIVTPEWVRESTRASSNGGFPENERYGLFWWVTRNDSYDAFFAGGFGGQFLYVVPQLDLVVVITSNLDRPHIENRGIIGQFIIPALTAHVSESTRLGRWRDA